MNIEEYVDFGFQVLKSNIDPASGFLTAARFGVLLRRANDETTWKSLGLNSLSSFLKILEGRGLVSVGPNEKKALSVWIKTDGLPPHPPAQPTKAYNPLRKSVWSAFVLDGPVGKRFLHRTTGAVRLGVDTSPSPVDEWVEIVPVSQDDQRKWAREYIRSKKLESKPITDALEAPGWYVRLTAALAAVDANAARHWNRCRSLKISHTVEEWCAKNSIQNALVFQSDLKDSQAKFPAAKALSPPMDQDRQRALVLAALAELPTESLLEIPIPAKYLFGVLQSHSSSILVR
jgi:hypothetical protein